MQDDSREVLGDQGPRRGLLHRQLARIVAKLRDGRAIARPSCVWLVRRTRQALSLCRGHTPFRVTGESMLPSFRHGELVFIDPRAYRSAPPRVGDVVVAQHPFRRGVTILKRVALVGDDGSCELRGDNPSESTDSRSFGRIPRERILGRVVSTPREG